MRTASWILPSCALAVAVAIQLQPRQAIGFTLLGGELDLGQRDFRVHNNFTAPGANANQTPHPNFPGATGAVMAIWKGCIEWQSTLHGDGNGDPHQPGGLGSGLANFDPTFQGLHDSPGGTNDNVHSQISGCNGGVLAYCEIPISDGWRIRYYECWNWNDGPGTNISGYDLQSVACHEYGHALGLGHSSSSSATMYPSIGQGTVSRRSIATDDRNGVQFIYGVALSDKPRITSASAVGDSIVIQGTNLPLAGGQAWFTRGVIGDGTPIKAPINTSNGTTATVTPIPNNVGPGDVLVLRPGGGFGDLSNAAPLDATGPLCPQPENYCEGAPNSVGAGMTIGSAGSTQVSDGLLVLTATDGPPQQPGLFFYGPNQVQIPFGDGLRCVGGGSIGTFRLPIVQIGPGGAVQHQVDWNGVPVGSGPGAITGGSTWHFQFWYRDPAGGPAGFNLSNARTLHFCP